MVVDGKTPFHPKQTLAGRRQCGKLPAVRVVGHVSGRAVGSVASCRRFAWSAMLPLCLELFTLRDFIKK